MGGYWSGTPENKVFETCLIKVTEGESDVTATIYRGSVEKPLHTVTSPKESELHAKLKAVIPGSYYDVTVVDGNVTELKSTTPVKLTKVTLVKPTEQPSINEVYFESLPDPVKISSSIKLITGEEYSVVFQYSQDDNIVVSRVCDKNGQDVKPTA